MSKVKEKEEAIKLRKKGFSYREILKKVPVAKSTLSLWLRSVGLAKKQKQRLTEKRILGQQKGARIRREQRIQLTKEIKERAIKEIGRISNRDLWLIGVALYWAEGAKEKSKGSIVSLGNSDQNLIKIFLKWTQEVCGIPKEDIYFRIFLHETSTNRLKKVQKYWAKVTGFPVNNFGKVTWKKHKINTRRKNIGENYYGLLEMRIRKSTNLNRRISGWIEGVYNNY